MPIYEYKCRGCAHQFEELVRPGSGTPTCPTCQSQDLERVLTAAAMSTLDQTKARVRAERKRRTPIHQAEQREEFQHTLREHLHDE